MTKIRTLPLAKSLLLLACATLPLAACDGDGSGDQPRETPKADSGAPADLAPSDLGPQRSDLGQPQVDEGLPDSGGPPQDSGTAQDLAPPPLDLGQASCDPNPCDAPHAGRCVALPEGGHRCDCDPGYRPAAAGDGCELDEAECPEGQACSGGYCAPLDRTREQCVSDGDCRSRNAAAGTTCNRGAAGGICLGCVGDLDCPSGTVCSPFGSCATPCSDAADCPYGTCSLQLELCAQARCVADEGCPAGTLCRDEDGDGQGLCSRQPCRETVCSPTFPDGPCLAAGEACIDGRCVAGCDPNPCGGEPHRGRCEERAGGPVCLCDPGYAPDADERCQPEAVPECPAGFACERGFCVDREEPGFQCAADADCGALRCPDPIGLPSGKCQGCQTAEDCPRANACLAGYCLQTCDLRDECPAAMDCVRGYCGQLTCADAAECPAPYVCGASGKCERPRCSE